MKQAQIIKTSDVVPGDFGHYIGDEPMTSAEAIKEAGLDWDVTLKPIQIADPISYAPLATVQQPIKTHKAVVRNSDNNILGIVGSQYQPVQNRDAFKFMDSLVDDGSMRYHTVGNLKDGKRVWLLGQTGSYDVVPGDQVDKFLFLWNSHDGSSSLKCMFTTIRVVCQNAVRSAFRNATERIQLRHTRNIDAGLLDAKEILGTSKESFEGFERFSKILAGKQINTALLNEFALEMFPEPPKDVNMPSREKARDELTRLFEEGQGNTLPGVKGSAWAAFNAVTEYTNHYKVVRGSNKEERRFEYSLFGAGANLAKRASDSLIKIAA